MDLFKSSSLKEATSLDYNAKCYESRGRKSDSKMLSKLSRSRLKRNDLKQLKGVDYPVMGD